MVDPEPRRRPTLKPLSGLALTLIAAGLALLTAAVVTALWWAGTRGLTADKLVSARFDALRIGLSIGIGGGGVFALYLAWRRQRSTEDDLDNRERTLAHQQQVAADSKAHQERLADASEKDATERRITDLYTKAADQLGSDKAPVRLAGLYALERLAQGTPEQRQTIVNVLCAYLRMPYEAPGVREADQGRIQEREVRLTAQRILRDHLRPGDADQPAPTFWADIDLDLTGATLIDFDLAGCHVRAARFGRARFVGPALFREAGFGGPAEFNEAVFGADTQFAHATFEDADFQGTSFAGKIDFLGASFTGPARLNGMTCAGYAGFESVTFSTWADFIKVSFGDEANFRRASFGRAASFEAAHFAGDAEFSTANFATGASFDGVTFAGEGKFSGTSFGGPIWFRKAIFAGFARFNPVRFEGPAHFEEARFAEVAQFAGATFAVAPRLKDASFERGASRELQRFIDGDQREVS